MKLHNKTILITGGSSGIGLELARILTEKGNQVLICGRSEDKLKEAKKALPEVNIFQCDISQKEGRNILVNWVKELFPECSVLINNAAITHAAHFMEDEIILEKAEAEINTNLMAPIALSKQLYPVLVKNQEAAIVNITTGLIYAPRTIYPIYCATKAALHSFTHVLRAQLENTPIKIIEAIMTVVDTPWHINGAPKIAISPQKAVAEMIRGIEKDQLEIKIHKVKLLSLISRISPKLAFRIINRP